MKITLSIITAAIVPFGFVVLGIALVGSMLAKRRQEQASGPQLLSANH